MEFKIVDSVSKINKKDWDKVFGVIPEGYEFYKTLESSSLEEFSFYYLILCVKGEPFLIAPLFTADFNLDIAVEGKLKSLILFVRRFFPRFLIIRSLFCGSPFGENGVIGLSDIDGFSKNEALLKLTDALRKFSRECNCKLVVFKDFKEKLELPLDLLKKSGFFKVQSFPSAVNEINFSSFEEYLSSLGSATRKSLRRKLREIGNMGEVEIKELTRLEEVSDRIYELYANTYRQGGTKFEKLTERFFTSASRNMQPFLKTFLYYVNGRLGAFNLCFVYGDLFIDKFIGFDYDISSRYNLYFLSWVHNINWCIKSSMRYCQSGQTDYRAKIRLGSKLVPLYAYFRHANSFVNGLLKFSSLILKPDNYDEDIRSNKL